MKERVNVVGAAFEGRACKAAARERAQERTRYDRLAAPLEGAATMKRGMDVLTGHRLPHLHHAR